MSSQTWLSSLHDPDALGNTAAHVLWLPSSWTTCGEVSWGDQAPEGAGTNEVLAGVVTINDNNVALMIGMDLSEKHLSLFYTLSMIAQSYILLDWLATAHAASACNNLAYIRPSPVRVARNDLVEMHKYLNMLDWQLLGTIPNSFSTMLKNLPKG